jgi:hypothetical protein
MPAPWLHLFGVLAWTWTLLGVVAFAGWPLFSFSAVLLAVLGGIVPLP